MFEDTFKEFCEGWVGGKKGSKPYQRNELFSIEKLQEQFDQHLRLKKELIASGVMITDEELDKIRVSKLDSNCR